MRIIRHTIESIIILTFITASAFAQTFNKEVKLTPIEKKQFNTFFGNFSEVFFEPFTKDKIRDSKLIEFSVIHNYKNNEKRFVKGGKEYQVKIKASYIDESVMKFFGKKISKHQSIDDSGIDYKDGWYYTTDATGEEYDFSQIVSLYDNGNGMYTAIVNIYSAGSGWVGDTHANKNVWEKASPDDVPQITDKMKATIQKVTEKGNSRYILIDYTRVSEPDYSGIYKLSDDQACDLVITIKKDNSGHTYSINGRGVKSSGKLAIDKSDEQVYIVFNSTLRSGDNAAVEGTYSDGKIIIQNYGNSMNEYICFKKCDRKYLEFIKEE